MSTIGELYAKHAASFDAARSRDLVERPYLDAARGLLAAGATVLDLGCGGGDPIARYFIEHGHPVTGVDASGPLLDLGRERFPEATWIEGDMRRLALGTRFDLIVAWNSFFHLQRDEQRAMFTTFAEHTRPGGALLFTSGPADGVSIGDLYGDPLHHASLDPDAYRDLLARHGYQVVRHSPEDPECGGHTVWLAQHVHRP